MCYTDGAARRPFRPGFHRNSAIDFAVIVAVCSDGVASSGMSVA
jgi:hypothetical protein